jgi:4-amino-4-deoxy-L-arabinose transferase-like glycosyltransferase
VVLILLLTLALRVAYLTEDRFHADEALYAGWALRFLDGDPFLLDVPVDKPPLFVVLLAGSMRAFGQSEFAARLPNLAASLLSLALVYRLAGRLYGARTARWAAFFFACSPFDVLFARTAFTDSTLVLWMLVALTTAATERWCWAGLATGLAFATKQHAVVLIPLVPAVGWASRRSRFQRDTLLRSLWLLPGFALPYALVLWWDAQRWMIRPGYWRQSAMSYGGLAWAPVAEWGERALAWARWARYLVGSPVLAALLVVGVTVLIAREWRRHLCTSSRPHGVDGMTFARVWVDVVLAGYGVAYLLLHVVVEFSVWDRYLLPLAPVASVLLGRIVVEGLGRHPGPSGPAELNEDKAGRKRSVTYTSAGVTYRLRGLWWKVMPWARAALVVVACVAALWSGVRAAMNGYPVGGEHWAYQGLDEAVAYLEAHAPPDAVLYHRWLRWHYTFYLYGTDFELRYWESGAHLQQEASRTPERVQYIVLPEWRTLDPTAEGVRFVPLLETRRRDGSVSLRVYRVEVPAASG